MAQAKRKAAPPLPPPPAPRGRGRPPHVPTARNRKVVETMVACGNRESDIARGLEISVDTLRKYYFEEIETSAPKANASVAGTIYQVATNPDHPKWATAAIFWMKCRGGWCETPQKHEITGPDGGPIQNLTASTTPELLFLPGETPAQLYDRMIRQEND